MVAPKARKHLSADALFHLVRNGFATVPDPRDADVDISLTDTLMSAFAMFSLKAPSLLAFDRERAEGNLHTIYGLQHVPCDTYMRERLDPISPAPTGAGVAGNFTADPTVTGASLLVLPYNQRATFRWVAAPDGQIISVLTAANGIALVILALNGGSPVPQSTVHWEE